MQVYRGTESTQIQLEMKDFLDTGLPRTYTPEVFTNKCASLIEQVLESYPEPLAGVCSRAGGLGR